MGVDGAEGVVKIFCEIVVLNEKRRFVAISLKTLCSAPPPPPLRVMYTKQIGWGVMGLMGMD